jgi:anti-sigma regulatory factor (Ser/Thr protein kinase)
MYEAEINAVIHANGGTAHVKIWKDRVEIKIRDHGPGIPNIELAMQEGYTTAPDHIRDMGFGAGMGLPNIKRYSDNLEIDSEVGKGTLVTIVVILEPDEAKKRLDE